ncbi:MAG: hypothetical protein K2K05_00845, partial [Muribaculaceae bacterium]|nr:hypothetical protein [Muribaculaceae bacterium]
FHSYTSLQYLISRADRRWALRPDEKEKLKMMNNMNPINPKIQAIYPITTDRTKRTATQIMPIEKRRRKNFSEEKSANRLCQRPGRKPDISFTVVCAKIRISFLDIPNP